MAKFSESYLTFDFIIGLEKEKRILSNFIRQKHIPHAFIFSGHDGIGKTLLGRAFVNEKYKSDLGGEIPLAEMDMLAKGEHPDVIRIDPKPNALKIGQILEVAEFFRTKPVFMKGKCLIVGAAHTMTKEAANSFLKFLEEPPPDALILLCTEYIDDMLDTVLSRCSIVRFSLLSKEETEGVIRKLHPELPPDDFKFIRHYSNGFVNRHILDKVEELKQVKRFCVDCLSLDRLRLAEELAKRKSTLFNGDLAEFFCIFLAEAIPTKNQENHSQKEN